MRKILFSLLLLGLMVGSGYCAEQWNTSVVAGTSNPSNLDTLLSSNFNVTDRLLSDYREGAVISYATVATLNVSAGEVACSDGTTTKWRKNPGITPVTWADIDTAPEENSTTYNVFALADADATNFTISISKSATTGTYYKKLGSFYNDAGSNITGIKNDGLTQFGDWVSKSANVVYQATTDGTVHVYLVATTQTTSNTYVIGKTDSNSSPTTPRTACHAFETGDPNYRSEYAGFSMNVKSRDYYTAISGSVSAPTILTVYWSPKEGG